MTLQQKIGINGCKVSKFNGISIVTPSATIMYTFSTPSFRGSSSSARYITPDITPYLAKVYALTELRTMQYSINPQISCVG